MNKLYQKLVSNLHLSEHNYFRRNILNALPFWVGALLTGLMSVLYAKLFAWAESGTLYVYNKANWAFFIITPLSFILAWWMVKRYAPYSRGSGIPQVSAAIELSNSKHKYKVNKLLGLRIIIVKVFSSLMVIFSGGVIGREGPTVQIAASIFKKINDLLPEWYPRISKQNMIITGAAAGLASAFNTPLGGIVFAIEELAKIHFNFFKSALLTGVIIAGLTALNLSGPYLYLGYPQVNDISTRIILLIIPIALFCGMSGSGMGKIILFIFNKKHALKKNSQQILYILICSLALVALAYFLDFRTFGSGKGIMLNTLFTDNKHIEWYIPLLRIIGPILTFTTEVSGGIFAPSLSAGASIGALISGWLHLSGTESNLIILCGMVGFLTGITRSPFTSSILVIEMTNDHNIIFHLMVAALFANIAANLVSRHSFYDHMKDKYIREIHASEPQEGIAEPVI